MTTGSLYFYDDTVARQFEPFALTRPACELRAGALLVRERWERALGRRTAAVVTSPHLADFDEPWATRAVAPGDVIPSGSVLVNSRCAVALRGAKSGAVWRCGGRVAAVVLARAVAVDELRDGRTTLDALAPGGANARDVDGRWLDHVWDFVRELPAMLAEDIAVMSKGATRAKVSGSVRNPPVFTERGAEIESHAYFDTSDGPVYVAREAHVLAFTRIVGPCYIGAESTVTTDRIECCAIGDVCKVHGEVSNVIMLGHANKGHDGFVGHSYLGRWVNLGAGTITSNLKNTYGPVQLWTPDGMAETEMQFLGTFFGDHVKTGIGTPLNTGTVIGAGANIFGGVMPPKAVPPFAWGDRAPYGAYQVDKFLEVAHIAMQRRDVELSPRQKQMLSTAHVGRWSAERAEAR